jgi:hypothetical protein
MATGPIYDAIADLELLGQKPTLERIQAVSGATLANVVIALKANSVRLNLNDGKIRLKPDADDTWTE